MTDQATTLNQALLTAMDQYAHRICFWIKRDNNYRGTSYRYFRTITVRLAHFLQQHGLSPGERLAIVGHKSEEWIATYMAGLLVGGIVVPLRHFLPSEQIHLRLRDCGARVVVFHDTDQYRQIVQAGPGLDEMQTALLMHLHNQTPEPNTRPLAPILSEPITSAEAEAVRSKALNFSPHTPATICYASDDSGEPPGAVFDQGQLWQNLQLMAEWLTLDDEDVAFTNPLPWSYIPNLNASLHYFVSGVANALAQSDETSFEDLQQISPTLTLTTPNAFDFIYSKVFEEIDQLPESSREIFDWALTIGREYRLAGSAASKELHREYARADLTFFSQIRGKMGGRLERFYTVGAPLTQQALEFAETIGLLPLNTYSVTEAGGFPAVSRRQARRDDSCGRVAPGFEISIAPDGEVLVRGETVMREYWRRPADTAQVLDADGWLHTGDLGRLDDEGYLYLTGHKQSPLVLSTGRKINPEIIEAALMSSPFIAQAVVFGDGRPYISALIVPSLEALSSSFQEGEPNQAATLPDDDDHQSTTLSWFWPQDEENCEPVITRAHPTVKHLLDKVISEVNSRLDQWEEIGVYSLLDQAGSRAANELAEFRQQGRAALAAHYAAHIEPMYPAGPQLQERKVTQVQVSPERLRDLLEKENILDAWMADAGIQFLFDLARTKHIDAPSLVHICDAAATIAQMESEEKPLSTALIVGDPVRIGRVLPASQIQLLRHDHIRRMRKILVTMAKMVDGVVLGYVVDKYGYVRGVHRLTTVVPNEGVTFLGPHFRRHSAISEQCEALVFFVPAGGRQVRVFADGQMVGRYANGDWSPDNISVVERVMKHLTEEKQIALSLVRRLLHCAFQMAEENLGAIFLLGEAGVILDRSDTSEISAFAAIVGVNIEHLSDHELINFAKQDGATVIDVQGHFRGCMVLLRPDANTQAEIGPGKGARHSSAAKMSTEANCVAITVSQDGPITIYENGRRLLSL
jgi:long-chain acyl-CoA synthetase